VVKKILVSDDDPFQQRIAEKFLTNRGIQVSTECSGHEGSLCLKTHPKLVEAIVTDISMPDMDDYPMTVDGLPFSRSWGCKPEPSEFLKSVFRLKKQKDPVC
jgi:CheY-like chemotaxis protein